MTNRQKYEIRWRQLKNDVVFIGIMNKNLPPKRNSDSVIFRDAIGDFLGVEGENKKIWSPPADLLPSSSYEICIGGYFSENPELIRPTLYEDCSDAPFSISL